ncbi:hypothetical protein TRVL_09927 [Trypanosoma vivax]|nr:hypothetical protein TRVL_09927 [Trypanosoma vivax]
MKSCDASSGIETTGRSKRLCFDLHALGMLGVLVTILATLSVAVQAYAGVSPLTCASKTGGGASFSNCGMPPGNIDNNINGQMTATFECTGSGGKVSFTCPIPIGQRGPGPNGTHENCTRVNGGQDNGESFACGPGNHGQPEREAGKTDGSSNKQSGMKGESTRDQEKRTEDKDSGDKEKSREKDKEKDKTTENDGDGPGSTVEARGADTQPKDTQPKDTQPKDTQPKDTQPKDTIFVSTTSFFSMNLPIAAHFVLRSALSSFALGPSCLC